MAAWASFDEGKLEEAIQLTRQSLEHASEDRPHAYAALGWFLLSAGSTEEALALLASSVGRYPEHAPLHWYLGLVHQKEYRLEDAFQALMAAVAFDPNLDEAAVSLAWVLGDMHRFEEAEHYARHALSIKTQPERLAQLGWFLLAQDKWEAAAATLAQALTQQPQSAETRCHLATALQRLGRAAEALQVLSDGLTLSAVTPALLRQHIQLLLDLNRSDEASASVARLLALAPGEGISHTLAAVALERNGDLLAAADHAEQAVACDDQSADAWRALAQVRTRQQRLPEAAQALQAVLALDSHNTGETQQKLGWICITERRFEDAITAFTAAVASNASDPSAWYGLARAQHAAKKVADALAAIQSARHLLEGWLEAQVLHGQILIDQGPAGWEEAVSQLTDALALQPESTETRCHLATVLQHLARNTEAHKVLSDGLEFAPGSGELLRQLADLLLAQHHTQDARTVCRQLLKQQPQEGMNWYRLSLVFVQLQRPGLALRALARARRLATGLPEPWLQTGWLSLEAGDMPAALDAVERLLELAPEKVTSNILAATVLERSGRIKAASEHAEKAVVLDARSGAAWRVLAQVRLRQSRLTDARAALQTALALEPEDTNGTYRQLGWVCVADSHYADAVTAFQCAVQNDAKDAASWYGLAEAHRAAHQFEEALRAIHKALKLRRDWPDAVQLRRRTLGEQIADSMARGLLNFRTATEHARHLQPDPADALPGDTPGAQYEYALCSFSTQSHLPLLRTLTASARRHFSGKIYLLLIDSDDATLIPEGAIPVRLGDVIAPAAWDEMVQRYNILELCCTLKPFLMRYVARATGCPVVYLDADTYLLGSLSPSLPQKRDFSVFLTPHLLMPFTAERLVEELGTMRIGVYNAGMVGVGTGSDALGFLDWWADRVSRYAYDAPEHGAFTDQKWLDLVPSFFREVQTSRDWGLNVGYWRVRSEQDFTEDSAGRLTFCGALVRLLHLSRFNPDKPDMLTSSLPHVQTTDSALGRFLRRYALEVIQNRQ
ncbi:tetratricopeptide repeat protein [Rhodoferax sp. AJA081-3]|uniref:tetratricopeptide repeat protein n=1 Tax=Rhodoferax sp. AJA081-3 TaxID=2752316 RepID=UPI001AE051B1|nr:tetratricopeptide repeat protein [Rhodoferax sp. AJA081-3]QTN30085.1 tetratricopeptide repeat protein [Rhodoferax sp. AJA081-3]